jgi:hypothetical protein
MLDRKDKKTKERSLAEVSKYYLVLVWIGVNVLNDSDYLYAGEIQEIHHDKFTEIS